MPERKVVDNNNGEDERRKLLEYEICQRDKGFWPELLGRWWGHQLREGTQEERREDYLGENHNETGFCAVESEVAVGYPSRWDVQ